MPSATPRKTSASASAQLRQKRRANLNNAKQNQNLLLTRSAITRNMAANLALFIQSQRMFLSIVNKSIQNLKNVNSTNLPENERLKIATIITKLTEQKNKAFRLVRSYNQKKK